MNAHIPSVPVVVEQKDEQKAPKAGYTAPQMFAVGQTVDLIRGNAWQGYKDSPYTEGKHYQ